MSPCRPAKRARLRQCERALRAHAAVLAVDRLEPERAPGAGPALAVLCEPAHAGVPPGVLEVIARARVTVPVVGRAVGCWRVLVTV